MVTVASPGLPTVTSVGSEDELIVSIKVSWLSNISSLFIGTLNVALVPPAEIVIVYGPEV